MNSEDNRLYKELLNYVMLAYKHSFRAREKL